MIKNYYNNHKTWFFIYLLVWFLANWLYFYWIIGLIGLIGLIIGLAINKTILTKLEITINVFK